MFEELQPEQNVPTKNKDPRKRICAVEGCSSNSVTDKDVVFHKFPAPSQRQVKISCEYTGDTSQVNQLEAWKRKLNIKTVTSGMIICSKHFDSKDYFFPEIPTQKRVLRKTAVPSHNLPKNFIIKKTSKMDLDGLEVKSIKVEDMLQDELLINKGYDITKIKLTSKDFGVQVSEQYKFMNLIKSNDQLNTAAGIESFDAFKSIVEMVKVATEYKYEKGQCIMKTEDRVLMTYVKLKQKCSYSFLAVIFNIVCSQHCRTVFLETAKVLSDCLKSADTWPSRNDYMIKKIPELEDFEDA